MSNALGSPRSRFLRLRVKEVKVRALLRAYAGETCVIYGARRQVLRLRRRF